MSRKQRPEVKEIINEFQKNRSLIQAFFEGEMSYASEYFEGQLEDTRMYESGESFRRNASLHLTTIGMYPFEEVAKRDDSSEFWAVIHFPALGTYIQLSGEYDSYGSGDHEYYGAEEVFPKQVTQTIYE